MGVKNMEILYKSNDYIRSELMTCRRLMSNKNTNLDDILNILIYMFLYCSENMKDNVYNHIIEIEKRQNLINLKE